jgi:PST family polysaccharide transporter
MNPSQTFIGTSAMAAASAVRVAIQIMILPIIGRLLGPHAYGQIALVSPFIFFSMMLAESGLGAVIVRTRNLSDALEGTVFSFSAGFSVLFIALFAALAWPIGYILSEPSFPSLLLAMSSILMLASLNIVPSALLLRAKRYNFVALSDIISTLAGIAALVAGVFFGWGVWSLVAQQVGFWIGKVMVVALAARWRPRLIFKWQLIRENIYFGSNLTGASVLNFISRNIDNILIGTFMGTQTLGFYALAFQIVGLPQMVLSGSIYYTMFSTTSEAQRRGEVSAVQFLQILRGALLVSAPTMIGLAVTAPLSVKLVLGDAWAPTATLIMLLMPFGLCGSIGAATGGVMIGLGRSDTMLRLGLLTSTLAIAAILLGIWIGTSRAVAIGLSLTSLFNCQLVFHIVAKACGTRMRDIYRSISTPLIASLLMGIIVFAVQESVSGMLPPGLHFALSIGTGILAYGLILFGLFRDQLKADIALIKEAVSRMHAENRA